MAAGAGDSIGAEQAASIGNPVARLTQIVYTIWRQVASGWWIATSRAEPDGSGAEGEIPQRISNDAGD